MNPFRKVSKAELTYRRKGMGFIPDTDVWILTLECGHELERTESKAYVSKARCDACGPNSVDPESARIIEETEGRYGKALRNLADA